MANPAPSCRLQGRLPLLLLLLAICPSVEARTWVVDGSSASATDHGPATEAQPFKTISAAAAAAQSGDRVTVHGSSSGHVYRERVAPANDGVTYEAAAASLGSDIDPPVVRGSEPLSTWQPQTGPHAQPGVWVASVNGLPFEHIAGGIFNPYAIRLAFPGNETRLPGGHGASCDGGHTLGQLFKGGQLLTELSGNYTDHTPHPALPPMSWMAIANGTELWARFADNSRAPPADVEVTVRKSVFAPHKRGLGDITVRGFVFEHAANQWDDFFWLPRMQANNPSPAAFAQGGLLSTRSGHNWLVEHNVLRHAKTIGIDIGDEGGADPEGSQPMPWVIGNHTIRWNRIVDNGGKGITGDFGSVGPQPFLTEQDDDRGQERHQEQQPCPGCEVHRNRGGIIAHNIIAGNNFLFCDATENAALKVSSVV